MVFKTNCVVEVEDINDKFKMTNKAILRCLQNVSIKHADSVGYGLKNVVKNGCTLVLLEWSFEVLERPKYGEELEVSTWLRKSNRKLAYKDFEIYSGGVKKIVASSKWILLDLKTFKSIPVGKDVLAIYQPEEKVVLDDYEMLEQDNYDNKIDYFIRKSDIDVNGHVHNLNYSDMALEVLDGFKELDNFKISYRKQIKYGDKIKINYTGIDKKYYVKIVNETNNELSSLIEMW